MTQPDVYFPDTAINALSFADYAATTEDEWNDQIRNELAAHFNLAEMAFNALLQAASSIPLIGPLIASAILGVEATVEAVAPWFVDLRALLGDPGGMGSGFPSIPDIQDIPLLGNLLALSSQEVVDEIVAAIKALLGIDLPNLFDAFLRLFGAVETFDPQAGINAFFDLMAGLGLTVPAELGRRFFTGWFDFFIQEPVEYHGWPYQWPVQWPASQSENPALRFFTALRQFFSGIDFTDELFDAGQAVTSFITHLLSFDLLAALTDVETLANTIADAFEDIPIVGEPIHDFLTSVWDVISSLFGTGMRNSADIAYIRSLIEVPPGGALWSEPFDAPSDRPLTEIGFTVTDSGSGFGDIWLGADKGRTYWRDYGGGFHTQVCIRTDTPLTGRYQYVAATLTNYVTEAEPPNTYLFARSDTTGENAIRVNVEGSNIYLSAVVDGDVTTLQSAWKRWANGATFELWAGGANDRDYLLKCDGETLIEYLHEGDDTSNLDNVYTGFGQQLGGNLLLQSIQPPHITWAGGADVASP